MISELEGVLDVVSKNRHICSLQDLHPGVVGSILSQSTSHSFTCCVLFGATVCSRQLVEAYLWPLCTVQY